MPTNPLATAFQAAAKVRPAITVLLPSGGTPGKPITLRNDGERWAYGDSWAVLEIEDFMAERLIEAACWRELPGWEWVKYDGWFVVRPAVPGYPGEFKGDTLALALLAAVAGLGGAE